MGREEVQEEPRRLTAVHGLIADCVVLTLLAILLGLLPSVWDHFDGEEITEPTLNWFK